MMPRTRSSGAPRPEIIGVMNPTPGPPKETQQSRKRKAAAMQQRVGKDAVTTTLQSLAVTDGTRVYYTKIWEELVAWLAKTKAQPPTEHEWDDQIAKKMDEMYLEGFAAHRGEKLLATVLWKRPRLSLEAGGRMVRSRQALRGWRRVCPHGGRLPLPMDVVAMICMQLCGAGRHMVALMVLLTVECYLRPAEPLEIRMRDVVPGMNARRGMPHLCLLLHPTECGKPAKNGEYDQTVLLDLKRQRPLAKWLQAAVKSKPPNEKVFASAPRSLAPLLKEMETALRLQPLGALHPYRFRHTGVSVDFATKARTVEEIQERGRWTQAKNMKRYQHGGRLSELMQRLHPEVRQYAKQCERALPDVMCKRRSALPCPWVVCFL